MADPSQAFDPNTTFVHLGLGGVAVLLPDFEWTQSYLERYQHDTELDGPEGRLVAVTPHRTDWETWERHPTGEELVVVLSGRVVITQEVGGAEHRVEVGPMQAIINPRDVWHTADVLEPGAALYVTPGLGTQIRPRDVLPD